MTKPRFVSSSARARSACAAASHLKATLLDVVELQAERLYATYDSPLVSNQTDPDAPDVAEGEKEDSYGFTLIINNNKSVAALQYLNILPKTHKNIQ